MRYLAIEDRILRNLAVIDLNLRKIVWISGAYFRSKLPQILTGAVRLREEIFDMENNSIIMYFKTIQPEDSRFGEALSQEFERRGFFAHRVTGRAAVLHMILRKSLLPLEFQNKIIYALPKFSDKQSNTLLKEIKT